MKKLALPKITLGKKSKVLLACVVLGGVATFGLYSYITTQQELYAFKQNPDAVAIKEKLELLKKIESMVSVPEDEEPTIATVQDATKLKQQTFFARAENGDKVIIYPRSGRAILFRPSSQKIIEAAPVNITDLQQSVAGSADVQESTPSKVSPITQKVPAKTYKVAIYNGTQTVAGLAGQAAELLEQTFTESEIEIELLANASDYYDKTAIVNFTDSASTVLDKLINLFKAELIELPSSEENPEVDFLIILGKDFTAQPEQN